MSVNKRLIISLFFLAAGITLIVLSAAAVIEAAIWSGVGGSLCTVAVAQIVRNILYRKNAEYRKRTDIAVSDERNRYLRLKAWSWAGYLFVLCSGAASIVLLIFGRREYASLLSGCICFVVFTYWAAHFILQRKE